MYRRIIGVLTISLLAVALGACVIIPQLPPDPNSPAARAEADRAAAARYNRPVYAPSEGIINKGETSGTKNGSTYVCADKDCKTARKSGG